MITPEHRFQTFLTRVRPHRVAVFINNSDPNWQVSCLATIEFFSKLWGGFNSVIIPTDGITIEPEFWEILSSYDPDMLFMYHPTCADLLRFDPDKYEEIVVRESKRNALGSGLTVDQIRSQIEDNIRRSPIHNCPFSEELKEELLLRLDPLHNDAYLPDYKRQLPIHPLSSDSGPPYPLTKLVDVLKVTQNPESVQQLVTTEASFNIPRLWLAATTGAIDAQHEKDLKSLSVTTISKDACNEDQTTLVRLAINQWSRAGWTFPFALTGRGLATIRSTSVRPYELPTLAVVGNTLKDFCLFYDLYWLQLRSLWIAPWLMPKEGEYPMHLISAVDVAEDVGKMDHCQQIQLVSYSLGRPELDNLRETISKYLVHASISVGDISAKNISRLVKYPVRVYVDGNIGDYATYMLLNGSLPGTFPTPVPQGIKPVDATRHRWMVDVSFVNNLIPRHPSLRTQIISDGNLGAARTTADAVSYMCPGIMVNGADIQTNLMRPSIHVPDAEEVFRIILNDSGYDTKTSDKGRYQQQTINKFGDLEKAAWAFRGAWSSEVFRKFMDSSKNEEGVFDNGVLLRDRRRYLDFASILKMMQHEEAARSHIDNYVEKGVLYRGYIFQCENCLDAAWHSIADVDQYFTCQRCGLRQQYKYQHWKRSNEAPWFYKLDEMVYLMLKHNGDIPLITLDRLRLQSKTSFLYRPELDIIRRQPLTLGDEDSTEQKASGEGMEIDICWICEGKLCIGEAKSNDGLSSDKLNPLQVATRYRDLALQIGASIVVFSTNQLQWNETSSKAIDTAFASCYQVDVRRFTHDHLYKSS